MPRRPRILLALVLAIAGVHQASMAADLMEAYQAAADSDPQIAAADARRKAARETRPQARAGLLPTVQGSAAVDQNFAQDGSTTSGGGGDDDNFTSSALSIQLNQPLFRKANLVRVRQAESIADQAEAEFRAAQQDLVLRVAERYFAVLSAQDNLSFVEADKSAIARQLEQAKRRFEVGLITITDVHEAQSQFDLATAQEILAINQLADSREALRELTGIYYEELEGLSDRMPLSPPEPDAPEAWVDQAVVSNPELTGARFALETARQGIRLQRAGHYPTLDLVAGYSDTDSGSFESSGGSIGLQVAVPLYQGGAVVSRTRQAAFEHEASKQNLESVQRAVIRQAQDAYRGLRAAISRVNALNQALVSTRSALEATEAGFEVGTRTIVDVLNAQRDLFRSERDYAQTRYDYILNGLRLQRAAGQVAAEDLEEINGWLDPQESN